MCTRSPVLKPIWWEEGTSRAWYTLILLQDQNVHRYKHSWLCVDPLKELSVIHIKFTSTLIVLGVMSNEHHIMPIYSTNRTYSINNTTYDMVQDIMVQPWIKMAAQGSLIYSRRTVLSIILAACPRTGWARTFTIMSSSTFLDVNLLDDYMWDVIKIETNQQPHKGRESLKATNIGTMTNMYLDFQDCPQDWKWFY